MGGFHFKSCVHAQSLSHLSLCDPMDCSLPGSSVPGISQARILEWVAISFSRVPSLPRDETCISCIGRWILYHCTTWSPSTSSSNHADVLWIHSRIPSCLLESKVQKQEDFPGGPMFKTLSFQCEGCGSDPWSGN